MSLVISEPAGESKTLSASANRNDQNAISSVLRELSSAKEVDDMELSFGYLEHQISAEDLRAQINVELFVPEVKAIRDDRAEPSFSQPEIVTSSVDQMIVRMPKGQESLALLLGKTAAIMDSMGGIEILDILISSFLEDDGVDRPAVTVYYTRTKD